MLVWAIVAGVTGLLVVLMVQDMPQRHHAIRRVYPLVGRLRYLVERIGSELRQYIVTDDLEERPFNRSQRAWVYQNAKGVNSTVGFGTQHDPSAPGSFHFLPSPFPTLNEEAPEDPYPVVIGPARPRPFLVRSRVNIAPMWFGALSAAAVRSLAEGAAEAHAYINTGEGGLSPHHLSGGGDVIFQIGPAKYGVRRPDGAIDWAQIEEWGRHPQVRAFEVKLSQGAKPGKGGILPAAKVTEEIAAIRGIPTDHASQSPSRFTEFNDVASLIAFGAPEFIDELAAELAHSGRGPDYISVDGVDGAEGGTGAVPLSLSDHMALPLRDAIIEVDDAYRRYGVRDRVTVIAAGRTITGADAAQSLALGADLVNVEAGSSSCSGVSRRCATTRTPARAALRHRASGGSGGSCRSRRRRASRITPVPCRRI